MASFLLLALDTRTTKTSLSNFDGQEDISLYFCAPPGKKEVSAGRSKVLVSNGSTQQHKILANGTLNSQSNLKEQESEEESESINHNGDVIEVNGHTKGEEKDFRGNHSWMWLRFNAWFQKCLCTLTEDGASFQHVASDSDSEVYCDSVDQFGAEEVRFS